MRRRIVRSIEEEMKREKNEDIGEYNSRENWEKNLGQTSVRGSIEGGE